MTDRKPNSMDSAMLVPKETLRHSHTDIVSRLVVLLRCFDNVLQCYELETSQPALIRGTMQVYDSGPSGQGPGHTLKEPRQHTAGHQCVSSNMQIGLGLPQTELQPAVWGTASAESQYHRAHMKYKKVKMPHRARNISMDLGPDCSITPPAHHNKLRALHELMKGSDLGQRSGPCTRAGRSDPGSHR